MNELIQQEIQINRAPNYQLGSYLYLGMALKNNKKVCISVGYKIDYCIKKIDEFMALDPSLQFCHISKIKTGALKACQKFTLSKPYKNYYQ